METIDFLRNLKDNNNKQWFEANKDKYNGYLREPMQELTISLSNFMLSIDPSFEIDPKKTISRINRDIRFSKDKSPYRANMWIAFKKLYLDWKAEPTYFFEISPESYRYGMGFYNIPKETLYKLRNMIDDRKKEFLRIDSLYRKQDTFTLQGEKYKKINNPNLPEGLNDWYQRKEIYFVCNREIDQRLFSTELLDDLMDGFEKLSPIYNFFLSLRNR